MPEATCPVNDLYNRLDHTIRAGRLVHPRSRRRAEEIRDLLRDVAWGRAGDRHLSTIDSLARKLVHDGHNDDCRQTGSAVLKAIEDHGEVFTSHVDTHNCATGACVKLTPAPCQMTCPAGIDVPTYVTLIGMGRDAEAIDVIRRDNPFPWICGLVCTRPCEFMCVRGRIDSPVSIKSLKAYAAEKALSDGRYTNPEKAPDKNRKVCVIGAGPGGLTAAYYLALSGYQVRVVESLPLAGGMMMVGIPRYRLPMAVIDREVKMIRELGVEFQFNTRFGRDVTFEQLREEGIEAFVLAIGCHTAYAMGIPGEKDYPQVLESIEFLKQVALGNRDIQGKKAAIIGGGNVAIDAARTCIRLGCEEVTIAYRRTRAEMPADEEEVLHAEQESVNLNFLTIPIEVKGQNGRVTGLKCLRARLVAREGSDRLSPVPIEGSDFTIEADIIIPAIGQKVDSEKLVATMPGLKWTRRNTIQTNTVSMETSMEGVFAVGDAVSGPATVVEAIGGGKRAAEAVDRYFSGLPQPKMPPVPVRRGRMECLEDTAVTKMTIRRPEMPLLGITRRRLTFQQVELGYSEEAIRREARRCLRCDICRRCGDCVKICREHMGVDALSLGYLDFDNPGATDFRETQERCITCGACAANCPNEAMQIHDADGKRTLSLCGTVLNQLKLIACESCGAPVGPARYQDFIEKRTGGISPVANRRHLCDVCSREQTARVNMDSLPLA